MSVTITRRFTVPASSVTTCRKCGLHTIVEELYDTCDALFGPAREIDIDNRPPDCIAAAKEAEQEAKKCIVCHGRGLRENVKAWERIPCEDCHGTGRKGGA